MKLVLEVYDMDELNKLIHILKGTDSVRNSSKNKSQEEIEKFNCSLNRLKEMKKLENSNTLSELFGNDAFED